MELEIQFAHDGDNPGLDKYQIHVRCFAAWEFERKSAMGEDVSADTGATKVTPRKRRDMPCEVCGKPIKAGEGHFREGLSWFHPECYERRKTKEHSPRNA